MRLRRSTAIGLVLACGAVLALGSPASAVVPRATSDRPDDTSGLQVHAVYVVPRDGVDRGLDTNEAIAASVESWQAWLRHQTRGRALVMDTFEGELDVTFFRLAADDATVAARGAFVREHIEEELYAAGFDSPTKLYAVYYDGGSTWACGGADPQPQFRGSFAAMYLQGTPPQAPPCSSNALGAGRLGYFEFGMLHEIVHTRGFVSACAPNARRDYPAGHVGDSPFDLMWAGPEPWGIHLPDRMELDVGRDDYFEHGRANCPDLAADPLLGPPEQSALTVRVAGRGRGSVQIQASEGPAGGTCESECTGSYLRGGDVRLTAVPGPASDFAGWEGGCSGFATTCTLRLDDATTVLARFAPRLHDVVVSVGGPGRVRLGSRWCARQCAITVAHGVRLSLRAVPNRSARFLGWQGTCGKRPLCHVVVTGSTSIRARFRPVR
jgi:hypothetical protein